MAAPVDHSGLTTISPHIMSVICQPADPPAQACSFTPIHGANMKWLFIPAAIWYWWRLYTLTFNPQQFPDPKYANKVWNRRASGSFVLGASMLVGCLYGSGVIHRWWVVFIAFAVSVILVGIIQPFFVLVIIHSKLLLIVIKTKAGFELGTPVLAPFAWTPYLTAEEKGIPKGNVFVREIRQYYRQATASVPRRIVFSGLLLFMVVEAWMTALDWHRDDAPLALCVAGFFLTVLIWMWVLSVLAMVWDWLARRHAHRHSAKN